MEYSRERKQQKSNPISNYVLRMSREKLPCAPHSSKVWVGNWSECPLRILAYAWEYSANFRRKKNISFRASIRDSPMKHFIYTPSTVNDYVNHYSLKVTRNKKKTIWQLVCLHLGKFWLHACSLLGKISSGNWSECPLAKCGKMQHNAAAASIMLLKKHGTFCDRDPCCVCVCVCMWWPPAETHPQYVTGAICDRG